MDINDYRLQIDEIDSKMRELFIQRLKVAEGIAIYKHKNSLPIFQPEREAQLIEKNSLLVPAEISSLYKKYLQSMMDISKEHQIETIKNL